MAGLATLHLSTVFSLLLPDADTHPPVKHTHHNVPLLHVLRVNGLFLLPSCEEDGTMQLTVTAAFLWLASKALSQFYLLEVAFFLP